MLLIPLRHSKAMHFIMSLLKSQGHDAIFVMVDLGSKLAHMVLTWGMIPIGDCKALSQCMVEAS